MSKMVFEHFSFFGLCRCNDLVQGYLQDRTSYSILLVLEPGDWIASYSRSFACWLGRLMIALEVIIAQTITSSPGRNQLHLPAIYRILISLDYHFFCSLASLCYDSGGRGLT